MNWCDKATKVNRPIRVYWQSNRIDWETELLELHRHVTPAHPAFWMEQICTLAELSTGDATIIATQVGLKPFERQSNIKFDFTLSILILAFFYCKRYFVSLPSMWPNMMRMSIRMYYEVKIQIRRMPTNQKNMYKHVDMYMCKMGRKC